MLKTSIVEYLNTIDRVSRGICTRPNTFRKMVNTIIDDMAMSEEARKKNLRNFQDFTLLYMKEIYLEMKARPTNFNKNRKRACYLELIWNELNNLNMEIMLALYYTRKRNYIPLLTEEENNPECCQP